MISVTSAVRRSRTALVWAAIYLAVGLGVAFTQADPGQAVWYPPLAIGVVMLCSVGLRWWPLVLALELVICGMQFDEPAAALVAAGVTSLEVVTAVVLLGLLPFSPRFDDLDDVLSLLLAAVVATAVGAALGSVLVDLAGFDDGALPDAWRLWFVGGLSGLLGLAPICFLATSEPFARVWCRLTHLSRGTLLELFAVSAAGLGFVAVAFHEIGRSEVAFVDRLPLVLALVPVLWVGLRFGRLRTAALTLAINVTALVAFSVGRVGRDLIGADRIDVELLPVEIFLAVVSVAGLVVAVAVHAERAARSVEHALLDASPVAIIVLDAQRRVAVWNRASERVFGWSRDEVIGRPPPMIAEHDEGPFERRADDQTAGPTETTVEYRHRDGSVVEAHLSTAPMRDGRGDVAGVVGIIEDVTDRRRVERDRDLLSAAIEQASEAVVVIDTTPAILYANPAAVRFSGHRPDELVGAHPSVLRGPDAGAFPDGAWAELRSGRSWQGTLVHRRQDGESYEHDALITPVFDDSGDVWAYVGVLRDLTRERRLEADLEREQQDRRDVADVLMATTRGAHAEDTAAAVCTALCRMDGVEWSALLRRLPGGRYVTLGAALPPAASIVQAPVNDEASAALWEVTRSGSWTVDWDDTLMAGSPATEALRPTASTALGGVPVPCDGEVVAVLVCGTAHPDGTAMLDRRMASLVEIGTHAGALLGPQLAALDDREEVRGRLEAVLAEHRFQPVFQPVVDLVTAAVVGFEALTRFDDGTRPDLVFAEAHAVGLGHHLERACISAALHASAGLPRGAWLSINVSPSMVLAGEVAPLLRDHPSELVLEVTEHDEVTDYAELGRALDAIPGVRVSVDDAGAGYASLRHIIEIRPDIVKLDIGLVRGIERDPARQAMVAGMRHYARETGAILLAEGVESPAEADTLRRLGVSLGQGYLFGRPGPAVGHTLPGP